MKLLRAWGPACLVVIALGCGDDGRAGPGPRPDERRQASADMCEEHGVPQALCTQCNPALVAVFRARGDFCEEHGFPESFCPVCNPDAEFPQVEARAAAADWCGGHGLPESMCTKCNPALVARFRAAGDFCEEHGFPESACPICNPRAPPEHAATVDWCLEHGLPESQCTQCNPSLVERYRAAGDYCEEHGFPESVCPTCNPQPPPAGAERAAIEARTVRLVSPDIEGTVGIVTARVERATATASVECTARIAFDRDRIADVRAIVPGIVRRIHVDLGSQVERGDRLFSLESTQVGQVQGALQTAREQVRTAEADLARQRELREAGITSDRRVELAEQEVASARSAARSANATLRMAGAARAAPSGQYALTAPIAGTVLHRPAVVGSYATEATSLATVGDVSVMWALCEVAEADAARIAVGQTAHVTVDGGDEAGFRGEITWIAAEVDPRTRTVTARAEVPNPQGRLRANQFARARIETSAPHAAVSVPRSAVQRVGAHHVVFVRTAPGVYEPRVVTRHGAGEVVQVEGNLRDGDAVVTTGAVLLRTEILPGSIGAGCCEVEPLGGG